MYENVSLIKLWERCGGTDTVKRIECSVSLCKYGYANRMTKYKKQIMLEFQEGMQGRVVYQGDHLQLVSVMTEKALNDCREMIK